MKKIIGIALVALLTGVSYSASAQAVEKTKEGVKKAAKKTANKTSEVAAKSKAKITDEKHKDKVGPNGEAVYIDNHAKFYYVDKKGKRHYVTEAELRDKPKKDE
jgi:hypothetical protein